MYDITSIENQFDEDKIKNKILKFVQNLVNGYSQRKSEYMEFIFAETVDYDNLLLTLDRLRLLNTLLKLSDDIVKNYNICPTSDYNPLKKELLISDINRIKADIEKTLKEIQKSYNEIFDIDDEDEYEKIQKELRDKRKIFRGFSALFDSYLSAVNSYIPISEKHENLSEPQIEISAETTVQDSEIQPEIEKNKSYGYEDNQNIRTVDFNNLDECAKYRPCTFTFKKSTFSVSSWRDVYRELLKLLYNDSTYAEIFRNLTAKPLFGNRIEFTGANGYFNLKKPFKVSDNFFAEMKLYPADIVRRIKKLMELCRISDENIRIEYDINNPTDRNSTNYEHIKQENEFEKMSVPVQESTEKNEVQIIDLDNLQDYAYCKPISLTVGFFKRTVDSWCGMYAEFVSLLCYDKIYSEKLKSIVNKMAYANRLDFADRKFKKYLRRPQKITDDLYVEANLSAINIVKRIKFLAEFCSVDKKNIVIEYVKSEKSKDISENDNFLDENFEKDYNFENFQDNTQPKEENEFTPNIGKPFDLKEALTEILSSDSAEIKEYREYKDGMSPSSFAILIEKYYKKKIDSYEILKFLFSEKDFKFVGHGCYVLNKPDEQISYTADENEEQAEMSSEKLQDNTQPKEENKFTPDTGKPFNLKDALIEIFSSDSPEIKEYMEKGGISINSLVLLIDKYYNRKVFVSAVSRILINEKIFKFVGNCCYALDKSLLGRTDEKTESEITEQIQEEQTEISPETRNIVLQINGNTVRAYDYSDALNKVCEFAINCKPFEMANITRQYISLNGYDVFCRHAELIGGYNRLSNGLQVTKIGNISDLQKITDEIKKYCQINDDMIKIISK